MSADTERALVLGVGDVGSAVAHRLFTSGFAVVLHDGPAPTTSRRGMAFADAVFDGTATLEGVTALRVDELAAIVPVICPRTYIPVVTAALDSILSVFGPDVVVDARMRKRAIPDVMRGLATLTIGLGPNFVAGESVDVAIETSWDAPGRIVLSGPTQPLAGEPRAIGGHARDRYVYAPAAGVFRTALAIGDAVHAGEPVATIGDVGIEAPLTGRLRGLTRDGVPVERGTKVIEVDPRGTHADLFGISVRQGMIADGVLAALVKRAG